MAKILSVFPRHLLFGVFWLSLLQITSPGHLSVRPGENITLLCNFTSYDEIQWYRLRSEEVKLLISAEKVKLKKTFALNYNVNETHFDATISNSSFNLVIFGVRETDLGFYYCGVRNKTTHFQFGKPVRLNFTDDQDTDNLSDAPDTQQSPGTELWIIWCVCLVSILINLIFTCVFCCRIKGAGKSVSSCSCCCNTTNTTEKDETIHYASIQHKRRSRAAVQKTTASDSDSVTYARVALQPRRY